MNQATVNEAIREAFELYEYEIEGLVPSLMRLHATASKFNYTKRVWVLNERFEKITISWNK